MKARDEKMVKVLVGTTVNGEMVFANINNEMENFILNYDLVKPMKTKVVAENNLRVYGDTVYTVRGNDYVLVPVDLEYDNIDKYTLVHDSHGLEFKKFLSYMDLSRDLRVIFKGDIKTMERYLDTIDILPFHRFVMHTIMFYCV